MSNSVLSALASKPPEKIPRRQKWSAAHTLRYDGIFLCYPTLIIIKVWLAPRILKVYVPTQILHTRCLYRPSHSPQKSELAEYSSSHMRSGEEFGGGTVNGERRAFRSKITRSKRQEIAFYGLAKFFQNAHIASCIYLNRRSGKFERGQKKTFLTSNL